MDAAKAIAIRERIRGNFDRAAVAYSRFEAEANLFGRLVRELLSRVPSLGQGWVLDVGCGTGASLRALEGTAGEGIRAVGFDISLEMLREAKRAAGRDARLLLLDGCRYGGAFRCRFEAVLYNAVLFMLPDARASLACAREVLRPGGVVLISSLEGAVTDQGVSLPDALAARGLQPGRHALSPWGEVVELLHEGFVDVGTSRLALSLDSEAFLAFYGLEPMSAGLLPSLPFPERRRVVSEFAAELRSADARVEQIWNLGWARSAGDGTGAHREEVGS